MTSAQLLDQQSEILKSQTAFLLVEIIEHLPKSQLVSCYYLVQFVETRLDFLTCLLRYVVECLCLLSLETRHHVKLFVYFYAVLKKKSFQLAY